MIRTFRFCLIYRRLKTAEVNFLCVHREWRSKRLAPLLIKEVTRRVNLVGIYQAIYTAGVKIPQPICTATYYHMPLNQRKLVSSGFCSPHQTFSNIYKDFSQISLEALRMEDAEDVVAKLNAYTSNFKLHPIFSVHEFLHYFIPREGIIYSFIKKKKGQITDFISFYSVPTTVLEKNITINVAYLFYYFSPDKNSLVELLGGALCQCERLGFDVFNVLDVMSNQDTFNELGFAPGDGKLNYYLFNWKTSKLAPAEIGFVLF